MKIITILFSILFVQTTMAVDWFPRDDSLYDEAYIALESTSQVSVNSNWNFIRFKPTETIRKVCLVIHPGAFINHRAYAPIAHKMAEAGFLSYVLRFPLRFALLKPNAAFDAKNDSLAKQNCESFVMAGHSLGGVVAARHANNQLDEALILLASYTEENVHVDHSVKTVSLWATEDGFTTPDDVENSRDNLPPETQFIKIEGGIHAHFAWVRPRSGDGQPLISVDDQQAIIEQHIAQVLEELDTPNQ